MRLYSLLIIVLLIALACSGCSVMPTSINGEILHASHPLAGWPVSADNTEDGLSEVNLVARWQRGHIYIENALGYNLQGAGGGGFYGPALTYTGRIGVEIWAR